MINMCRDEDINWDYVWSKQLSKDEWKHYGTLNIVERRKFLIEHNFHYKNVPRCKVCGHVFFRDFCNNEEGKSRVKLSKEEMNRNLNISFTKKLKFSRQLVKRVIKEQKGKKIYLAYSGGIDSECCVQLFKEWIKKGLITVVTGDTLVEFPETRKRWKELQDEIPEGKFIITRPECGISFKMIVQKYGFPIYSRGTMDRSKAEATKQCCQLLKDKPMLKATKDIEVIILGLRKEENQYRGMTILRLGNYFYSKALKTWRVYPIAYWNIEDVWKFQEKMGFKYNLIYDKTNINKKGFYKTIYGQIYQIRTGCWSCPQSIRTGYIEWLKEYYPRFYDALVNKLGMKNHIVWAELEAKKQKILKKQKPCGEPL